MSNRIIFSRTAICKIHSEYDQNSVYFNNKKIWNGCPECEKDLEKRKQKEKNILREISFTNMGLPKRYWHKKLKEIVPGENQQEAIKAAIYFAENFKQMSEKGQTLIFCGSVGTGKTLIACALLQEIGGRYIRAIDISRSIRDGYTKNKSELEIVKSFANQKLLVIDEVGIQLNSENEKLLITDLIDRRNADLKPTIICTNLNEPSLKDIFGVRAWDRLTHNCLIVPITGRSRRCIG